MFTLLRIVKWFLRKKYGCDSIAFYLNNIIVLKCTRFFSHHDFSFSLAYVAVPGIQSTPSSLLDGSTSTDVPSPILISASESKFQSFPFYGCVAHLMSTVFATSWYTDIRHFTVKWFLRKKYGCDSIAFYCNNTIVYSIFQPSWLFFFFGLCSCAWHPVHSELTSRRFHVCNGHAGS